MHSHVAEARDNIPRDPLFGTGRASYNVSGTSCKLLEDGMTTYHAGTSCKLLGEDVSTWQELLASYLTKMLQRIKNVLQVTWRRCYNVPGTSCKLIEKDVTTYHVLGTSCKLIEKDVTTYHVLGTSCKLLEEEFTTYQEHLASYLEQDVAT